MFFLVFPLVTAEKYLFEEIDFLRDLDEWEPEEGDDELDLIDLPSWTAGRGHKVLVNVDSFGAVGDGVSDDTKAFEDAWKQACSTRRSVFLVPAGRRYLVNATRFRGPCAGNLVVQIDGTIIAPDEPKNWDPNNPRIWLAFLNLTGVSFQGKGVIDGSGSKWWAASCKKNKSNAFTIDSSSAIKVKGITIQNSQQMHFTISRSDSVRVYGVRVSAPEDSPNTDGIHIAESTNVVLQGCKIGTGLSGIKMKKLYCGPGHGISLDFHLDPGVFFDPFSLPSIGSLGKDNSVGIVTKVGGSGYVRGVRFQNVRMEDVYNPIIIDQFYCDSPKSCENQTSAVEISEVIYTNITGTSKSQKAMKFACSDSVPCTQIVLDNINLDAQDGTAEVYCNSATGIGYGLIHPSAECLSSSDKEKKQQEVDAVTDYCKEPIVHTEL
nr:probable polygalacturonase At1g80170 [Ipomoea batatas]